jgi:hypothetical protein
METLNMIKWIKHRKDNEIDRLTKWKNQPAAWKKTKYRSGKHFYDFRDRMYVVRGYMHT